MKVCQRMKQEIEALQKSKLVPKAEVDKKEVIDTSPPPKPRTDANVIRIPSRNYLICLNLLIEK
jgi:hypothetical protein